MKMFTSGNIVNRFTSRANYVGFSAICANSTNDYSNHIVEHTGSNWLKSNLSNNDDDSYILEHFSDYDKCNFLLKRLYQDFIESPYRDDLRISLFSHLDKKCILSSIEYYEKNKDNIFLNLKQITPNSYIDLNSQPELRHLSHLLYCYQENPIVVFHALKLQTINDILTNKKNKKYVLTQEEEKKAENLTYQIMSYIKDSFYELKSSIEDLKIQPVLLNDPASPSHMPKHYDDAYIPLTYKQNPFQTSAKELSSSYNAYQHFILNNKINKKTVVIKKNKI